MTERTGIKMTENEFNKKMSEIIAKIDELPSPERERMMEMVLETQNRHKQIANNLSVIREHIDDLSLGLQYLLFDLDATKRENKKLREELEQ